MEFIPLTDFQAAGLAAARYLSRLGSYDLIDPLGLSGSWSIMRLGTHSVLEYKYEETSIARYLPYSS